MVGLNPHLLLTAEVLLSLTYSTSSLTSSGSSRTTQGPVMVDSIVTSYYKKQQTRQPASQGPDMVDSIVMLHSTAAEPALSSQGPAILAIATSLD